MNDDFRRTMPTMRRFAIWGVLAVVLNLVLFVGAVWAAVWVLRAVGVLS